MFGFFKRKPVQQSPGSRPTEKQLRYAARLGIRVDPETSRADLSAAIAQAENQDPSLAERRHRVNEKVREYKFGPDLLRREAEWNELAEGVRFLLAIYKHRSELVVDVLELNEAFISEKGKLILAVAAPELVRDRHAGNYLDWDRSFELPAESVMYHEPLHAEFFADGVRAYQKAVEKGLKIAKKL